MDKKPKIDLKNGHIGGQPKDWIDRAGEPSHLGGKEHGLIWGAVVLAALTVIGLAWLAYRLLF